MRFGFGFGFGMSGGYRGGGGTPASSAFTDALAYWQAPTGLTSDSGTGFSKRAYSWEPTKGVGTLTREYSTTARQYASRLYPSREVITPGNDRFSANVAGSMRGMSFAVLLRNRRKWSAETPNVKGRNFLVSFVTANGNNPGFWVSINTAIGGYAYNFFDGGNRFANGKSVYPVGWTPLIVTVSSSGTIKIYENGRELAVTGTAADTTFSAFKIGRVNQNPEYLEIAEMALWQKELTAEEAAAVNAEMLANWDAAAIAHTVTITGDSIIAGETYVTNDAANFENTSICEELQLDNPTWRVVDLTLSSTVVVDGQNYMENLTSVHADAKGGKGFHDQSPGSKIHLIQHARNNLSTGSDVATVVSALTTAISNIKAYDSDILVGISTVIATKFTYPGSGAWADQGEFDQGCIDFNAYVLANYASMGADFVADFGGEAEFEPVVGETPYTNTTYYATDQVHPNGVAGKALMLLVADAAISAAITA